MNLVVPTIKPPVYPVVEPNSLLSALKLTPGLRFIWPLWESSGLTAYDYSGNGRNGTYDGVTLDLVGPNPKVPIVARLDGLNDLITGAAGCSVRGLASYTFVAVVNITDTAANKDLWMESTGNSEISTRFGVRFDTSEALVAYARSGISTQGISSQTSTLTGLTGARIIHVTVDVPNDQILLYNNGVVLEITGIVNFGADTVVADTAPLFGPALGRQGGATPNWTPGLVAFVGMFSPKLDVATILGHARAGGLA